MAKCLPPQQDPAVDMPALRMYCARHSVYWELEMLSQQMDWLIKEAMTIQFKWAETMKKVEDCEVHKYGVERGVTHTGRPQ